MDYCGIFENKNGDGFYWMDGLDESEKNDAKYFVDADFSVGYHQCVRSALYDDVSDRIDGLQTEQKDLEHGELYVVTYFEYDGTSYLTSCLEQPVDFGLTKEEIIKNVEAGKYAEGATYYTMGQMFYATKKMLEEAL